MSRTTLAALAAGALALAAFIQPAAAQTPAKNDYADKAAWLCWPGRADACSGDNTATVITAAGVATKEAWKADPKAPIDCFYVYPTVSRDKGVISDMTPNAEERSVVEQQLSRFASKCRVYAPMYRQFTLTALREMITNPKAAAAAGPRPNTGYTDVVDAWNHYLAHENKGRGVVLIGHSQGSGVLTQLIAAEIDGKPAQKHLISALLLGTGLPVTKGGDTGTFMSIPLCKSPTQTGCAVAYASFLDNAPPPANSRFGRPREAAPAMEVACVNPASLAGGKGELHSYMAATGNGHAADGWAKGVTVDTPFVSLPGLLSASCVNAGGFNYLAVHVNGDPADPRLDVIKPGAVTPDWGLHLVDVNVAMGNLVDLVDSQGKAWLAKH
jgi:pimeloyl-ACP methyl ester carboxylesterase